MFHRPPKSAARREQGFALLITITLLAFLVLLLVSLASLTRVETQVASNNQHLAQARQNALMALNIAVGQLQKYAGPDQRTTARADLENGAGKTNSQWIGTYGSSVTADYSATPETIASDLSTATNLTATGSPSRLLNWLVSGNETAAFDPAWSTGSVGAKGQITAYPDPASATSIPFRPAPTTLLAAAGAVANLSTTTPATDTTLTITNASGAAKPARLLVGQNSVTSVLDASSKPVDYVVAPAVDIIATANSVPGIAGTPTIGRYAWWVGDEGMKARVNLPLAGTATSLTAAEKLAQQRNAFSNSTRDAIELMARDNNDNWPASAPVNHLIDTLYTPGQSITSIVAPSQTTLASSDPALMSTALKFRFHDITTQSLSVLSDTYAGGLKRDLSVLLDPSYSPSASDPTANTNRMWVPHSGDDGTSGAFTAGFEIPTWKHLRSYAQKRIPIPASSSDIPSLQASLPANDKAGFVDDVGVGPVITYYSMGFRAVPAATPADGVELHMAFYPLVIIWNPYNFTLKAPAAQSDGSTYEVGIYPTYNVQIRLEKLIAGTPSTVGSFDFQKHTAGTVNDTEYIRFRLKCGDILPGQSLIFSLPHTSSGQLYTQQNILENIEPEPSAYVSVPFRDNSGTKITIQTGEAALDYQLNKIVSGGTNFSSSFWNGGGGTMFTYLGKPDSASRVGTGGNTAPQSRLNQNPSNPARSWFNSHQSIGWDNNVATNPIQGPEPLAYDTTTSEPSYVFLTQALFSGQGNNAQLDTNQFMFTTRWLAQGNMRATRSGRTRRDNNYNVLFTATTGSPSVKVLWQKFINNSGSNSNRASAGQGHDWINGTPVDVALFEFPYDNQPLQSIGQLQHANLSLIGDYPAYPVGNSLGDFRLHGLAGSKFPSPQPAGWQLARVDTAISASLSELGTDMKGYYDISYLLNRNLWDRYYFSTVPATGSIAATDTFPNTRHLRYNTSVDVQNPDRSASGLVLAGGFNINSTSEQAWRAVLGGGNQLNFDPEHPEKTPDAGDILAASFPRFTRPRSGTDPNDAWTGYRTLDANQIAQLARNIVTEIRNRGPFISLADFVNRRLVDNAATAAEDETFRGPIQAALDTTTSSSVSGAFPANDATGTFWTQDLLITSGNNDHTNQSSQYTDGYYSRAQVEGRLNATTTAAKPYGSRSAFAPKYITQADILAKIGAGLSGRSDTFTIRTYGETVNPATQEVDGRAWCEAVVQRLPEYVEPKSGSSGNAPEDGVSSLTAANQAFGRKFKIISFRWLSPNDI
jgi:hypothetical protein